MGRPGSAADSRTVRCRLLLGPDGAAFFGGVMNLCWIGGLALFVLLGTGWRRSRGSDSLGGARRFWLLPPRGRALERRRSTKSMQWGQICRCGDLRRTDLTLVVLRPWGRNIERFSQHCPRKPGASGGAPHARQRHGQVLNFWKDSGGHARPSAIIVDQRLRQRLDNFPSQGISKTSTLECLTLDDRGGRLRPCATAAAPLRTGSS